MVRWSRVLLSRWRGLIRRDGISDELREEIQFHIDRRTEEHERRGLTHEDAQRVAIRRFGNPAVIQDRGYDVRGGGPMESILHDVRYGVRLLVAQRRFSLVALATLALGVGATTAIFCVADAALIRPLPYPKPEQLVRVGLTRPERPGTQFAPSLEDMDHWRALKHVFSHIGTSRGESLVVVSGREPERVTVPRVTLDYLPMYGASPILGRGFTADDERLGAPLVALIGYRYWQTEYHGDRAALGRTIQFSNESAVIVGVLRDDESRTQTKILTPLQATDERRRARQYAGWARLRDGVTLEQAQREVDALMARLSVELPQFKGLGARVTSEYANATATSRTTVNILLGAVGFVLMIACVNVASLQLARGTARHTELAIRASMGAGRGRLIRQLVTESLVLSMAGSALGAVVAWLVLDTLVANVPIRISSAVSIGLNLRVLAATAALATLCGLVFGLLPALRSSATDINAVLGRGSRGIRTTLSKTLGGALIAIEVAAAIVLVTGAALMLRSFARIAEVPLGFDPNRFVTLEVAPVDDRPDIFGPFYASLLERVRTLPGVASAGGTNMLPLSGSMSFGNVTTSRGREGVVIQGITPGYLETIGVPLIAGSLPKGPDVSDVSWIVLSDRAAKRLFPNESPIGQQVQYDDIWRTVIGVVGHVEIGGVDRPLDDPQVYVGFAPGYSYSRSLAGRTTGQPMIVVVDPADSGAALPAALRDAAKAVGPNVIVRRVREGREWWSDSVVTPRQRTVLLSILGGLGLLLALVGVFGVTSFAVARRVSEIGVRMAFGARPRQVVAAMVKDAVVPIALGITAGLVAAFFLTRVIATFLYRTESRDPGAFAAAACLLALCGVVAAWLPARKAARVDPVTALRSD